jgi:opacity protein-like surface antigen
MRKILLPAAVLFSSGAFAADAPAKTSFSDAKSGVVTSGNWDGGYIGISASTQMGNVAFNLINAVEMDGFGTRGFAAGAMIGYNYFLNDRWMMGLEASAEYGKSGIFARINDGAENFVKGFGYTDWSSQFNVRLGYLITDETLLYGSAGGTVVHGRGGYKLNAGGQTAGQTWKDLYYGVGFAALGVETEISGAWRARFEYVASFLNTKVYRDGFSLEVTPQFGTARIGLIYALGAPATRPSKNSPTYDWNGFYFGFGPGRNHSVSEYDLDLGDARFNLDGFGSDGWSGSVFAGYNHQAAEKLVVGLEAIGSRSSSETKFLLHPNELAALPSATGVVGRSPDSAGARLRLGYLVNSGTLMYGFGGVSRNWGSLKTVGALDGLLSQKNIRNGFEIGGGSEVKISQNVSTRVEYGVTTLKEIDLVKNAPALGKITRRQSTGMVAIVYTY